MKPDVDISERIPPNQLGWVKQPGSSTPAPYREMGTWSVTGIYTPGMRVQDGVLYYICILRAFGSGQAPGNTTYWKVFDNKRWILNSHRDWIYVPDGPVVLNAVTGDFDTTAIGAGDPTTDPGAISSGTATSGQWLTADGHGATIWTTDYIFHFYNNGA